jgi:nicotinamidase-related amidase/thiamine kinase-like enzyme
MEKDNIKSPIVARLAKANEYCSPPFYIKLRGTSWVFETDDFASGAPIQLAKQTFEPSDCEKQLWKWRTDGSIQSVGKQGLVLTLKSEKDKVSLIVKALMFGKDEDETNSFMQRFVPFNHYYFMNTYLRKIAITQTTNEDSDIAPGLEWIDVPEKAELQHFSQWQFEYLPIPFYIQLRDTNLVLDVYYKKKEPGTPVVMFRLKHHHPWNTNQLWRFRKDGIIESVFSGLVLDSSSRLHKNLIIFLSRAAPNQKWTYNGAQLLNLESSEALEVALFDMKGGAKMKSASNLYGARLISSPVNAKHPSQIWDLSCFTAQKYKGVLYYDDFGLNPRQRLEAKAFAQQINALLEEDLSLRHYLPFNPDDVNSFVDTIKNGLIPCKLLASIGPQIDSNVFNERYLSGLNQDTYLETAVNLAGEFGCEVPDTNEILRKPGSLLEFVWQMLRIYVYWVVSDIPDIVNTPHDQEVAQTSGSLRQSQMLKRRTSTVFPSTNSGKRRLSSVLELSNDLLTWVNLHLKNFNRLAKDLGTDFQNGENYLVLLHVIGGAKAGLQTLPELHTMNDRARAALVVESAKKMGIKVMISVDDIMTGNVKTNLLFLTNLYRANPSTGVYTIFITQSFQNDFCSVLNENEPLPSTLHIGHKEARRILGDNPAEGPMIQLLLHAKKQQPRNTTIIHIRDYHDDKDSHQKAHLERFGPHCIKGSKGSAFVWGDFQLQENEFIVDGTGLNDFEHTNLKEILEAAKVKAKGRPIRVGVVGVWTDAKIYFTIYELKTRMNFEQVATCSALTASFSRSKHFNALEQIQSLLETHVFDSVAEYANWLFPDKSNTFEYMVKPTFFAEIQDKVSLLSEDKKIMGMLFRNSTRVSIDKLLTGGFSGARVLLVTGYDAEGHEQGPFVIKLGPRDAIAQERINFEKVEPILGNYAPALLSFAESETRGGIKFAFASHEGNTISFKSLYSLPNEAQDQINKILKKIFGQVLARFYTRCREERFDLLAKYEFDGKGWGLGAGGSDSIPHIKKRIMDSMIALEELIAKTKREKSGEKQSNDLHSSSDDASHGNVSPRAKNSVDIGDYMMKPMLEFVKSKYTYKNVVFFMQDELEVLKRWSRDQSFMLSFVHGDLNLQNIMVDENHNIWLIDFFFTTKAHVWKDILKVENDIMYCETSLYDADQLEEALAITEAYRVSDAVPQGFLAEKPEVIKTPHIVRAWNTVSTIRSLMKNIDIGSNDLLALHVTLLRYTLHTMTLGHLHINQKIWALASACVHADNLRTVMKEKKIIP